MTFTNREWDTWLELEQKMLQNLLRFVDTVELWQKANSSRSAARTSGEFGRRAMDG
jgi:hypothetical protein